MKTYCFLISFVTTLTILSASHQNKASLKSDGTFQTELACNASDIISMVIYSQFIINNKDNCSALKGCKNEFLQIPTVLTTTYSLILCAANDKPVLAEEMLQNFVSPEKNPEDFAWLIAHIGSKYIQKEMHEDAIRTSHISLNIMLNSYAIKNIVLSSQTEFSRNNSNAYTLKRMAYWLAKHRQKGFAQNTFLPQALETICNFINTQPDQTTNFTKDLERILKWEAKGRYNPEILLKGEGL